MNNELLKRIVLVDDHVVVRNGLKELVEKLGPYQVVGQFGNGCEFVESLAKEPLPDLAIVDLNMPEMDGLEVMEHLNQINSSLPVIMLTLSDDEKTIVHLFKLGARGYLLKNCSGEMLKNAIQQVLSSGYFHNEFLTLMLNHEFQPAKQNDENDILSKLSGREREFLKWVCHEDEFTYEQIADRMNVQPRTVDGYREILFEKYGIKSKTGLVLFVLKYKLFDLL
jgi:two-component system, NarL family, invasion response regulator UvrY